MSSTAIAGVFAIFIWWFSTGIVLLLNGMQRKSYRWSLLISSLLGLAALYAVAHTAQQTGTAAAYCAFTSALLVWGWHELSFLTGWITGPRTTAIPASLEGWPRFVQAVRAILWHELAIVAVGLLIVAITRDAPNQVGTWTFLVLWSMRTSAKLNLFFGVRNLSEEFLPPHLTYLQSFFRRRAMNLLFPFCVSAASGVLAWMVMHAMATSTPATEVLGLTLVGAMLALAILEHWMLVLPVSTTALWRWAMSKRKASDPGLSADSTPAAMATLPNHKNAPRAEAAPSSVDPHDKLLHAR